MPWCHDGSRVISTHTTALIVHLHLLGSDHHCRSVARIYKRDFSELGSVLVVFAIRKSWNSTGPTQTLTPTQTSLPTSTWGSWRGCRRVRRLPHSACHELDMHDDLRWLVRRLVQHARFSSRILARTSVRDARMYTCKRVLYTISYCVHVYKITRQTNP